MKSSRLRKYEFQCTERTIIIIQDVFNMEGPDAACGRLMPVLGGFSTTVYYSIYNWCSPLSDITTRTYSISCYNKSVKYSEIPVYPNISVNNVISKRIELKWLEIPDFPDFTDLLTLLPRLLWYYW